MIRIACIDDHQLFLEGLSKLLDDRKNFHVVGIYHDPKEFLHAYNNMEIDVITSDVEMPSMSGMELCKIIKQRTPKVKLLFISMFETRKVIQKAQKAGADGFVSKNIEPNELIIAIKNIINGHTYFQSPLTHLKVVDTVTPSALLLTKREKEIIILVKEGNTSKEIAQLLHISEYTVETHRKNIFKKLKITSLQELISFAFAHLSC